MHFIYEQDIWTNKKGKNIERKRAIKFDCKQRVWCVCVCGWFVHLNEQKKKREHACMCVAKFGKE